MSITITETRITHKYLMNKTKDELAWMYLDLLKELEISNDNKDRFMNHLEKIANHCEIEYMDGDFTIEELINYIDKIY
jgi:hypothetical protein